MATPVVDIHQLRKLQERYPFSEEELEILVRCHVHLLDPEDGDDFLLKLATASPYQYFFLPGDEMRDRVTWIEDYVLPAGFCNELKAAISVDAFVEYANQGEDKKLERFLEGVADTGRRGTKEALRLLYRLVDQPEPEELIDFCVRLAVASDVLVAPTIDKGCVLRRIEDLMPAVQGLAKSLKETCGNDPLTQQTFVSWSEENFPMLPMPLSTFVHNLLFHGHAFPQTRIEYTSPKFDINSNIFEKPENSPELMSLSLASPIFGGKWHRIYSSFYDGRSFNRLEWSLMGYNGPTLVVVKTTAHHVLGGFASEQWKQSKTFYGNADCFLFELTPKLTVYRAKGGDSNFMYLHSEHEDHLPKLCSGQPHGLAFGGTLDQPRLFIPESFQSCSAGALDKTFQSGELLPIDTMEKFEIQILEVWGVGGDETITKALRDRADFRERYDNAIHRARIVHDKTQFADDFQSGLIPAKLYDHQDSVRGRHDFRVDDKHGGYEIEH